MVINLIKLTTSSCKSNKLPNLARSVRVCEKTSQSTTTEHYVSVSNRPLPKIKTYLYANWNGALSLPPPPTQDGIIISMSGYSIYDTHGDLNDLMIFDKTDKEMIVGKVYIPTIISLSVSNRTLPKIKTYLYANWKGALSLPPPPTQDGIIVSMSGYDIYDTHGHLNDLMIFDKTDNEIIVGKVSTRKANNHSAYNENTRQLMVDIPGVKPKAKRGQQTDGVSKHYSFFGHRKDPLNSGELGEYCLKKIVPTKRLTT